MRDNNFAMKIKSVVSLIAFAVSFTFSVALANVGTDNTTGQNISQFLKNDIRNGQIRNAKLRHYIDNSSYSTHYFAKRAATASEYADAFAAIDSSNLP